MEPQVKGGKKTNINLSVPGHPNSSSSRLPPSYPQGYPHELPPKRNGGNGGNSNGGNSVVEEAIRLCEEGWRLRVRKIKGSFYLYARRYERGKRREKYLGAASEEDLKELEERGLLKRAGKPATVSRTTTIRRRPPHKPKERRREGAEPEGGVAESVGAGFVLPCFHNVQLRYIRGDVDRSRLLALGFAYNDRNGQWVQVYYLFSRYRRVTIQVNPDGTAQVYLRADDEPLDVFEFLGWCKYWLLERFRELAGRDDVSLRDFVVMTAPELNVDVPGVLLEGAKGITLSDYYDALVRVYVKSLPNGGVVTRIEARDSNYKGVRLSELAEGVIALVRLPRELSEMRRDIELIRGSLPKQQIDLNTLKQALATELANLIYLSFEKVANRFELALREFAAKVDEVLGPFQKRLEELEEENRRLHEQLQKMAVTRSTISFEDLPEKLRKLLLEMQRDGYIRITRERISYGDKVWEAIYRRKGNLDYWLDYVASEYLEDRELFKRIILAIRYYDNKFGGKVGVPWDKFLHALRVLGWEDG